jgi:hypothetical protein
MFKHILVPIDLSGGNARTLRTALALATQNRARVTLLQRIGTSNVAGSLARLAA